MASRKKYLNTSDARENLAEIVNQVAYGSQRVILGRRGRAIAALVPMEDLKKLESLDEAGAAEETDSSRLSNHKSPASRVL
jgi:prevent-host-death family protein